jgi:hypothetical protein
MWFAGLASAIAIKLTSSIDDVVWLAPFLTSNVSSAAQVSNSTIYISVCLIQTLVAMFLAYSGNSAVTWLLRDQKDAWSSDKILTVGAGSLLALYAIKLAYDYFTESEEEESKPEETELKEYAEVAQAEPEEHGFSLCCVKSAPDAEKINDPSEPDAEKGMKPTSEEKEGGAADRGPSQLFIIAFIGSVDDLTVFVPMLVGKAFDLAQLMLGAFIAAAAIVAICLFIGLCKPIADCLSSVPLALIVAIFSAVLLTKGYMME